MKKISKQTAIVYAGMIAQNVSALKKAAFDLSTACDEINKIANKIAVAAGVENDFEISLMIFNICESIAFNLWNCKEYDVPTITAGIKDYIGK